MKVGNHIKAYSYVVIAGILWGTIGVFVKELSQLGVDAATISFLRVFFAGCMCLVVAVQRYGFHALKIDGRSLFFCALLGVVCHGIYNIFYSHAVALAGVSVSAVLLNVAPAITLFTSALLFGEQLTGIKLVAVAVNIFGCALTVTGGQLSFASFSVIGILCGVGAGVCYALTAIFGRYASNQSNPVIISTYSYFFAALALVFYHAPVQQLPGLSSAAWLWAFGYALIPTTIGYFLYYAGVQKIEDTSRVPVLASLETVVAALLGIGLYHEALGTVNVLGIVLVMSSIMLMNLKYEPSRKARVKNRVNVG